MVSYINKHSVMALYSKGDDLYSHSVRIVLAEKGISFKFVNINVYSDDIIKNLKRYNPYDIFPILVDKDLILYKSEIIMEYLDERFPYPPLMPVYPVVKGRIRLMIYRINRDWYSLMNKILDNKNTSDVIEKSKEELNNSICSIIPIFSEKPYFLSEDFSLIDCYIAPLLWRLQKVGIKLSSSPKPIFEYANRIFHRSSFKSSLVGFDESCQKI